MTPGPGVSGRRAYFVVSATIVGADQVTKALAHAHLAGAPPVELIPGLFNLIYSRNPGGLFGYFGNLGDPWRGLLLTLLPIVAVALISLFLFRGRDVDRVTLSGMSLILGGAVGNLIDRVTRGEVIDFLDVYASGPRLAAWLEQRFGTAHWPTFNLADSAIVVGAALLLLDVFRPRSEAPAAVGDGGARAGSPAER